MGINYPDGDNDGIDVFDVPSNPQITPLSSAGSGHRNIPESIQDLGLAVMALEGNASFLNHDHSGDGTTRHGNKLVQANTHQSPDTDELASSLHHTLGRGATQAAAGNHTHDYTSNDIFNKPLVICTSTTRPTSPQLGLQIYEQDTKRFRIWDSFPNNTLVTGYYFTDTFERVSNTSIGGSYTVTYANASPQEGTMATPDGHSLSWIDNGSFNNQAIAQLTGAVTETDDQIISFQTGNEVIEYILPFTAGASMDAYFRMSADGQSYWRMSCQYASVSVYTTTTGRLGETLLGQVGLGFPDQNMNYQGQLIGNTLTIYQDYSKVGAVTDKNGVAHVGAAYRGHGIGLSAGQRGFGQTTPSNILSWTVQDVSTYASTPQWQLLGTGATPHLEIRSGQKQSISPNGSAVEFHTTLYDTFGFFDTNLTDVTITESGVYHLIASISWDENALLGDHAMTALTINGQDTGYKHWEFVRGFQFVPGFSQTVDVSAHIRFVPGDVLRVVAAHNGISSQFTWFGTDGGTQDSILHLKWLSP